MVDYARKLPNTKSAQTRSSAWATHLVSKKRLNRPIRNGPRIATRDLIVIDELLHLECDPDEDGIGNWLVVRRIERLN